MVLRLSMLASALVLAGCSFAPQYQRPAAPTATEWPAAISTTAATTTPAASIAWQDFFTDARLKRLIQIALDNNRDLRVAILNIEKAQAQYQIQRSTQFPTIGGVASAQRQARTADLYTLGVGVTSYELDFFGRVQNLKDATLAQYLATEEARKSTQISLIAAVANQYLSLLADDEMLKITEDTLKTRDESLKLAKLRFDHGVSSELDLRQAETLVEGARASRAQLLRQRALDENALTLLIGQPIPADLPAGERFASQPNLLAEVPAGLPSDLLQNRPDIAAAEQALIAANANIGAARAAFFPRITLTGSFGFVSTDLGKLFDNTGWSFAPQLTVPLFDWGNNQANLEAAKVSSQIAVAQYEKSIQTAFREVSDALAGQATLGQEYKATLAQVEAVQKSYQLSDLRYRNGVSSYLDLLDAQRSLFSTQQAAIQIQLAQLQNRVTLYKTLGGGWKS